MLPAICCCCGAVLESRDLSNPNECVDCAALSWGELAFYEESEDPRKQPPILTVFEEDFPAAGPAVVECFEAVEKANQALTEALAREQKAQEEAKRRYALLLVSA